jgi:competence protein ComEA
MDFEELRLTLREKIEDLGFDLRSYQHFALLGLVVLLLLGIFIFYWWNRPVQVIELKDEKPLKQTIENRDTKKKQFFLVHVAGAVRQPGVYQLPADKRVIDAIAIAGGATKDAYLDALNLAAKLSDEMKIYVPSKEEKTDLQNTFKQNGLEFNKQEGTDSVLININTASSGELERLPGIGPILAERIIEYRKNKGLFTTIEDLKKVEGIGPKKFQQLKDKVTVD